MPAIAFDRFHRYAELTQIVHTLAREHPNLIAIESIGKSHEGRDLWVVTVSTRPWLPRDSRRPAVLV